MKLKSRLNKLPNVLQYTSIGLLFILPKCSLCLFAIASITVCGANSVLPPLWEYGVVVMLSFIPLLILYKRRKKGVKVISLVLFAFGFSAVSVYLFAVDNSIIYNAGLCAFILGVLTNALSPRNTCGFLNGNKC